MKKTLLLLPGPVPVAQPVLEAMAWPLINHRGPEFAALLKHVDEGMRPLFGTKGPVMFLGSSGTGALEAAVGNLFSPGDSLLSCAVGVFGKRLASVARTYGCNVEELDTSLGHALDPNALAARLKADTNRSIKGVLLTHNETSTGVQNDMSLYVDALKAHGALSVVDSVSGLGATAFEMDAWGYDIVVTASQKALAVPPGIAMVAASGRAWSAIESATIPRFYFDLRKAREFAAKGQTVWTPPISIFQALRVGLDRYHEVGLAATCARHARYAKAIAAAFTALGFTIFSQPNAHSVTVVAAAPPDGVNVAKFLTRLRETYGVIISDGQAELIGKIVRFGTMGDVSEADLLGAIAAMELALRDIGANVISGSGVAAASKLLV